jgi:hypothetical protein
MLRRSTASSRAPLCLGGGAMTSDFYNWYPAEIEEADVVIGILKEAKKVIERGWVRNKFASDGRDETSIDDEHAVKFCLIGAIRRVSPNMKTAYKAEIRLSEEIGIDWYELESWNDRWYRTKRSVMKALEKSIINTKFSRRYNFTAPMLITSVGADNRYRVTAYRDETGMVSSHIGNRRRGKRAGVRVKKTYFATFYVRNSRRFSSRSG